MTTMKIPSAVLDKDLELNMTEIYFAESRVDEIALVNTHKAPELMTCFIKGYTWLVEHIANITAEAIKAENAMNFRKAVLLLDEVPRILKEKGITGKTNEDYRNAVVAMDKEHIDLRDNFERLLMYKELFKGKLKSMDNAYMAVRKVFGSNLEFSNPNLGSLHSQSSYSPVQVPPGTPVVTITSPFVPSVTSTQPVVVSGIRAGFGRAKD